MSLTAQNSKLALLENYVATLERENRAKSKEIDIIYGQLQVLRCENGELKSCLEQRHEEKAEDKFNSYRNYSLQTSIVFEPIPEEDDNVEGNEGVQIVCQTSFSRAQAECQTSQMETNELVQAEQFDKEKVMNMREQQREFLQKQIYERECNMERLSRENEQMYDAIETLESKLAALQERNSKAEHKIKSLQEACCQAEEDNRCLHSQLQEVTSQLQQSNEEINHQRAMSSCQLIQLRNQVDVLVKENNEYVQRIIVLEKEKNAYYLQLKAKGSYENRTNSKEDHKRQQKNQRKVILEEKIRRMVSQNEQIEANLAVY